MSRPAWCPNPNCYWITGGGTSEDSGMACGGRLPLPETHDEVMNTHRFCLKAYDEREITSIMVNKTDMWYLARIIDSIRKDIEVNE
jgi:hypothetical protein